MVSTEEVWEEQEYSEASLREHFEQRVGNEELTRGVGVGIRESQGSGECWERSVRRRIRMQSC